VLGHPPDRTGALEDIGHVNVEILAVKIVIALPKEKLGSDISGKCADGSTKVQGWFYPGILINAIAKLVDLGLNNPLPVGNSRLWEEVVQGSTTPFMEIVLRGADGWVLGWKCIIGPVVLVPTAILAVELLEEAWVADVKLVRTDSNNRAFTSGKTPELAFHVTQKIGLQEPTVFLMHFGDFECILAIPHKVVVGFIVSCDGRQLRSREPGQRMEEQPVNTETGEIDDSRHHQG
jgi:hypothetical protein